LFESTIFLQKIEGGLWLHFSIDLNMKLRCQHLNKEFQKDSGAILVLEDITFEILSNEFVCLVGPSGCGKSTLLRIIAGLEQQTSGCVEFASSVEGNPQNCAMVFQDHGLFPWMTVVQNIVFGLEFKGLSRGDKLSRAHAIIERIGLSGFESYYPGQLSGGMRQRVGIARAFLSDADILLMDEPFGSLDAQTRLLMQAELLDLWKERQKTVIYITHDIEEAILLGDRVLIMNQRPSHILDEFDIPLKRPRNLTHKSTTEEMELIYSLKWQIWDKLEIVIKEGH